MPKQLLTDQGNQFIGHLCTLLYRKLHIDKLKTTPYHPQSHGCLERWHGTLVPMLKKSLDCKLDWAKQVKFAVFASRVPLTETLGFPHLSLFLAEM